MQRIFKYGNNRNIAVTPNKESNILITDRLPTSSYTGVIQFLKMCGFYWATLYDTVAVVCAEYQHFSRTVFGRDSGVKKRTVCKLWKMSIIIL